MNQNPNLRKSIRLFLTDPPQRYFLLLEFGILLTTLVFLLSLIMSTVTGTMESSFSQPVSGEKLGVLFDQMVYLLFVKISLFFAIVFFLNALLGLFFLERLTGPLVRIQKILEEIGSGRIPDADVNVRSGDYPSDLAAALSSAIAYLRRKKAGI